MNLRTLFSYTYYIIRILKGFLFSVLHVRILYKCCPARYKAKIFEDGENADYETNPYPVNIYETEVSAGDVLKLQLARSGGTAAVFEKIKAEN